MMPIFITFWSDDFVPNQSMKSNCQSLWIKTATIFTMDNYGNKVKVNHPLLLLLKGARHEVFKFQYSINY